MLDPGMLLPAKSMSLKTCLSLSLSNHLSFYLTISLQYLLSLLCPQSHPFTQFSVLFSTSLLLSTPLMCYYAYKPNTNPELKLK